MSPAPDYQDPPASGLTPPNVEALSEQEFEVFRTWLFDAAAIELTEHKRSLVASRLLKRVQRRGMESYGDYFMLLQNEEEASERQLALDLLTTNETSFFREPKHFDFMRMHVLPARTLGRPFKVWSAASSSGEEAYTIAMELAEHLGMGVPWDVMGSDISNRVLEKARGATYPLERANLPDSYFRKYCLKGVGEQKGLFRIQRALRERVQFQSIALNSALPKIGPFDIVFLRNVLIYFNLETRQQVIRRIEPLIAPHGYLFVSHSENLQGVRHQLSVVQPSIYRRVT